MGSLDMKKIIIGLLLVMIASFTIAGLLGQGTIMNWNVGLRDLEDLDITRDYSIEGISKIELQTISTDIRVISTDGSDVKVHLYGKATRGVLDEDSFAKQSSRDISVLVKPRPGINMSSQLRLTLDVYVPSDFSGKLHINTVSGDSTVSGLSVDELQFRSVSGSLTATLSDARTVDTKTTSGNITLSGLTGSLTAKSVSGDMFAAFANLENDVTVNTTSGKTRLTLPPDSEFEFRLETVSGKMVSEIPLSVSRSERTRYEGSVGAGGNRIQVKSVSGDVDIYK